MDKPSNFSKIHFSAAIIFVATIVILFLVADNEEKNKEIKNLRKRIDENDNINSELKKQLNSLIKNNEGIDPKIANELIQISALLEIQQESTAIFKLAKIIENLLIKMYKGDPKVRDIARQNNRKEPVFADYLEHGKNEKIIPKEDFHLLLVLKMMRNEEAHQLDVKKEKGKILSSFITGVGLIFGLCRLLKLKNNEQLTPPN